MSAPTALDRFWQEAESADLVVLTDFDYTITTVDVGDLITDTLAPPSAETLQRFAAGEIGTPGYWLDSMARAELTQALALADGVTIDPHFPAFVRWCESERIPLAILSDGFGFYIRRILEREGLAHLPVICNEMPEQGRLEFPGGNPVCSRCACCKAQVARRLNQSASHIAYVGDGTSDLFASGFVDWVFARGTLARHMAAHGSPFFPLTEGFHTVQQTLAADLAGFRSGTAAGRSTLRPDPICRFE